MRNVRRFQNRPNIETPNDAAADKLPPYSLFDRRAGVYPPPHVKGKG